MPETKAEVLAATSPCQQMLGHTLLWSSGSHKPGFRLIYDLHQGLQHPFCFFLGHLQIPSGLCIILSQSIGGSGQQNQILVLSICVDWDELTLFEHFLPTESSYESRGHIHSRVLASTLGGMGHKTLRRNQNEVLVGDSSFFCTI